MILTINYLNAGVNLSELGVLFAFAIDQIPRTHLTILWRANQEIIVLDDGCTRQTQYWCGVADQ